MPDRSLRLPPLLLRERHPSHVPPQESDGAPSAGGGSVGDGQRPEKAPADDNPFAPPPEGAPDRPWRPRLPDQGQDGSGEGERSPWGSQWSDRQPGPATGGRFGERPGSPGGPGGQGGQGGPDGPGSGGPGAGLRWDPTDPAQRRARYALLGGMWAFFFALFSWQYVALLLGALSLYWGVSALRSRPRTPAPENPTPPARPQTTAAISGLVTASVALALVATTFAAQLVYRDYYTCVNDALTTASKQSCNDLLPKDLRGVLGTNG
ncbi:hypothetical protein [Streptomyces sp. Ru72]|uniref:hypothetical protein n=1 Tax=Streptomyces sp. Ru72 TaxID=2080747 RepID=UPI000CDD262E|nr:hypothetical protein [Streptomyces sp. Ru72]POX54601.1 hypothetical protein C3488_01585 [Streptomyces sp. Ru72]